MVLFQETSMAVIWWYQKLTKPHKQHDDMYILTYTGSAYTYRYVYSSINVYVFIQICIYVYMSIHSL